MDGPGYLPMVLDHNGKWISELVWCLDAVTINNKKHLWIKLTWLDIVGSSSL